MLTTTYMKRAFYRMSRNTSRQSKEYLYRIPYQALFGIPCRIRLCIEDIAIVYQAITECEIAYYAGNIDTLSNVHTYIFFKQVKALTE